jgi:hypothetical protein
MECLNYEKVILKNQLRIFRNLIKFTVTIISFIFYWAVHIDKWEIKSRKKKA